MEGLEAHAQPEAVSQIGIYIPLGMHESQATKEKIWDGAYVDLSLLYTELLQRWHGQTVTMLP